MRRRHQSSKALLARLYRITTTTSIRVAIQSIRQLIRIASRQERRRNAEMGLIVSVNIGEALVPTTVVLLNGYSSHIALAANANSRAFSVRRIYVRWMAKLH